MKIDFIRINKDSFSSAYKFILDSVDEVTCLEMDIETHLHQDTGEFDLEFRLVNNTLKVEILEDFVKLVNFTSECRIPNTEFVTIQIF